MVVSLFIGLVALLHINFLILEMFFWSRPLGAKIFGHTKEYAASTRVLAANQGLYNGFLAAGLVWSLFEPSPAFQRELQIFFLACVIVAGLYGAYSVGRKILFIQALPAAIALILVLIM